MSTTPRLPASIALAALGLGAFTVGTSELVVVGILDPIASDAGVSISAAGGLVTVYALGIAVGGPIATALTANLERRRMLTIALVAYLAGNLLTALATSFGLLLVSRAATGTLHGLFIGIATVVAANIAEPGRAGRAISIVFGGIAVSTVVGVPLGTLVGQAFSWRAAFVAIVLLGGLALALVLASVPRLETAGSGRMGHDARSAVTIPVLALLGVGFLVIGGQFTTLTYLAPFLNRVTGISGGGISGFLLAFGAATAAGAFASGRLADRNASVTLIIATACQSAALGGLYLVGRVPALTAVALVAWGLVGFGLVSTALQVRLIGLAGRGRDLAASLGASAANAGIAAGAQVGGLVIAHGAIRYTALASALILLTALPATVAARLLRAPAAIPLDGEGATHAAKNGRGGSHVMLADPSPATGPARQEHAPN